jgi:hypothetical protein
MHVWALALALALALGIVVVIVVSRSVATISSVLFSYEILTHWSARKAGRLGMVFSGVSAAISSLRSMLAVVSIVVSLSFFVF